MQLLIPSDFRPVRYTKLANTLFLNKLAEAVGAERKIFLKHNNLMFFFGYGRTHRVNHFQKRPSVVQSLIYMLEAFEIITIDFYFLQVCIMTLLLDIGM